MDGSDFRLTLTIKTFAKGTGLGEVMADHFLSSRIVYHIAGMDEADCLRDNIYKIVDGEPLMFDVYRPCDAGNKRLPAVIFVHGEAEPDLLKQARSWGQYISWGELIAASGMAAVTFNRRSSHQYTRLPDAASDVDDLIQYIRDHADQFHLHRDRLAIFTCSAGGPLGLRAALRGTPEYIRCAIGYYPLCDLIHLAELSPQPIDDATLQDFSPVYLLNQPPEQIPPMFLAKAALDRPHFNRSIDRFIHHAEDFGVLVDVVTHHSGRHGFDIFDDDDMTREIIRRTLNFLRLYLGT